MRHMETQMCHGLWSTCMYIQGQVTHWHGNCTAYSRDNSYCNELSVAFTNGLDDGCPLSTQGQRVHGILNVATSPHNEDIMIY